MSGYINSQTWEAWFESYEVSWNNTSFIFIVSVALSLAIVIATWMMSIPNEDSDHKQQDKNERKKLQDIQEANTEEESEEEKEMDEERIGKLLEFNQLPGEVKKVQRQAIEKKVETQMSAEQLMAERKAQSEQLAAIFKMMQDQEEKFGETTIDEIKDQMKLYCG